MPFIDIQNHRNPDGDTLILLTSKNFCNGYNPEIFSMLLNRGANIQDQDDFGRSCLHLCVERAHFNSLVELQSLKFLISKGADPFAVDDDGMSVSDYAYRDSLRDKRFSLGSYRGDLWDAALAQSGFDMLETRQSQPRRPNYTTPNVYGNQYLREDFKRLWEGFEDLCPYYDDPLVWPPGARIVEVDMEDDTESEDYTDYENNNEMESLKNSGAETIPNMVGSR
jgi:Ankyrin repeat